MPTTILQPGRRPLRVSFDMDDTLVCTPDVPCENLLPWWSRWRFRERMRLGTSHLLQDLALHCEIWIYTTSFRPPRYLRSWFCGLGVRLSGVVNQDIHERTVGRRGPSKLPRAFGIDLHVDDSEGVAEEGRRHGFRVLVISPQDADWTAKVREAVDMLLSGPVDRGPMV